MKARILVNGLCPCPLHNLKDHAIRQRQRTKYLEWVGKLIRKYKIDGIYAERYMSRGMGGPTIESVNMMLGLLQSFQLPDRYIPAAVWKNAVRRQGVDLKLEYKICRSAPHQLDASLIGLYGLHQAFCIKDFGSMGRRAFVAYTNQVEKTSKAKLYNRKAKR